MPRPNTLCRKYGTNVDFDAYKAYRAQNNSHASKDLSSMISSKDVTGQADATAPNDGPKMSYQEIVDLIQSGKPVPGIKDIPTTVLEGQGTAATQSRRRKPWEKDTPVETVPPAEDAVEAAA
jgi:hypothetical protein